MRIHVAVPYVVLKGRLREVLAHGISPEIYFDSEALEEATARELEEVGRALKEGGLTCSVHAPYMDLQPGALDRDIREVTLRRFLGTLEATEALGASVAVFHPGYIPQAHGDYPEGWMERAEAFWSEVAHEARRRGVRIALENVFEEGPEVLSRLLAHLDGVGFCFDPAHGLLFGRVPLEGWLDGLGERLVEVHVHNNYGERDQHLPPHDGLIDYRRVLGGLPKRDLILTLEVHQEERVLEALEAFPRLLEEAGWRT